MAIILAAGAKSHNRGFRFAVEIVLFQDSSKDSFLGKKHCDKARTSQKDTACFTECSSQIIVAFSEGLACCNHPTYSNKHYFSITGSDSTSKLILNCCCNVLQVVMPLYASSPANSDLVSPRSPGTTPNVVASRGHMGYFGNVS